MSSTRGKTTYQRKKTYGKGTMAKKLTPKQAKRVKQKANFANSSIRATNKGLRSKFGSFNRSKKGK